MAAVSKCSLEEFPLPKYFLPECPKTWSNLTFEGIKNYHATLDYHMWHLHRESRCYADNPLLCAHLTSGSWNKSYTNLQDTDLLANKQEFCQHISLM